MNGIPQDSIESGTIIHSGNMCKKKQETFGISVLKSNGNVITDSLSTAEILNTYYIFTKSLYTGELPTEWTQANVAPIFKKGSKLQAVNYRPVSLTCITCKLLEHIICKHILALLEDHKIINDLQHGFRSGRLY